MKFPTLCSLHTFKSKSDISLLSHQSSLQRKHRYSSWQVYGAVKSNNTVEEWLFRSWESAPILWAGVCWYSLNPFSVSIPVQRLDIKNILLGTKSHSWILQCWTWRGHLEKKHSSRWDKAGAADLLPSTLKSEHLSPKIQKMIMKSCVFLPLKSLYWKKKDSLQ